MRNGDIGRKTDTEWKPKQKHKQTETQPEKDKMTDRQRDSQRYEFSFRKISV